MKKLVVMMLFVCMSMFALDADSSATEIKRATIDGIKEGNMTVIIDLLKSIENLDLKKQTVIVKAIEMGFNHPATAVKKNASKAIDLLKGGSYSIPINIYKLAGGKWGIQISTNPKAAAIPRAAVEKPTLSTNPLVNCR